MTDKDVKATGDGSVAIGGSVKGSKLATNVETTGGPHNKAAGNTQARISVEARGSGSIAVGGDLSNSTVSTNVNVAYRTPAGSSDAPVEFPLLQDPVDLILRIARVGDEEIGFDARSKNGRQVGPFKKRIGKTAERFAAGLSEIKRRQNPADNFATSELLALGLEIGELIPKELLEGENWLLGESLQKRSPSILILTDEPYIPWELALVPSQNASSGQRRYLGEIAEVGRWPINDRQETPRAKLNASNLHAFAAESYSGAGNRKDLLEAVKEREFLVETFGAIPHAATRPVIDEWLRSTQTSEETVHMALHGYSDPRASDQGLILGDGEILTPQLLLGVQSGGSARAYSLVFLNACQTGTGGESLGQVAGFPGTLARNGAGAVIAPLWEVDDREARDFAEKFYEKTLNDRMQVGNALKSLRQRSPGERGIARLAYIFYGHPLLQLN
jgi:CHAT domain-containing protein